MNITFRPNGEKVPNSNMEEENKQVAAECVGKIRSLTVL